MANPLSQPIGARVVDLEDDSQEEHRAEKEMNFVIKVLTEKEIPFTTIKSALLASWGKPSDVEISNIGRNKVLASFKDRMKGHQLWRGGPWIVRGCLVNMKAWGGDESVYDVKHDKIQFWVQFHGIPKKHLTQKTGKKLGEEIGEVCEVEEPFKDGSLVRHFIRARILVDINQPLPVGCWIRLGNDIRQWIDFKYEKLFAGFCLRCGLIGHNGRECKNKSEMSEIELGKPKYSRELGVNRPRAIHPSHIYGWNEGSEEGNNIQEEDEHEVSSGFNPINQANRGSSAIADAGKTETSIPGRTGNEGKENNEEQGKKQGPDDDQNMLYQSYAEKHGEGQELMKSEQGIGDNLISFSISQEKEKLSREGEERIMEENQALNLQARKGEIKQHQNEERLKPRNREMIYVGEEQQVCNGKTTESEKKKEIQEIEAKYTVEFPEDEQEEEIKDDTEAVNQNSIEKTWEQELALAISTRLKLKRMRESNGQMLLDSVAFNEDGTGSLEPGKRRKTQHDDIMAEEAGLIMPHPQP